MATNSTAQFLSFLRSPPQIHHQRSLSPIYLSHRLSLSSPHNRRLSLFYTPRGLLFSGGGNGSNGGGGFFGAGGGGGGDEGDAKGRKKISKCGFFRPPHEEEVIFFDRLGDADSLPDRASYNKYIEASTWGLMKFILGFHLVMLLLKFVVDTPEIRMRQAYEMKEAQKIKGNK